MNKTFYKGIRYQDVLCRNIEKGGEIKEVHLDITSGSTVIEIVTEYADGMTISKERLIYREETLLFWGVCYNDEKNFAVLFSRKEYENKKMEIARLRRG